MRFIAKFLKRKCKICLADRGIYGKIRQEREYQDKKWGTSFDDKNTINDWICFITAHAGTGYNYPPKPEQFKEAMIKVAALAIAAIEAGERNGGYPAYCCSKGGLLQWLTSKMRSILRWVTRGVM